MDPMFRRKASGWLGLHLNTAWAVRWLLPLYSSEPTYQGALGRQLSHTPVSAQLVIRSSRLTPNGLLRRVLWPVNTGTTFLLGAVSQKQVYEILIRHTQFRRHLLEVT